MTLGAKLSIIFFCFIGILVTVIFRVFRERTRGKSIAADDYRAQQAQDGRILALIFSSAIGGMLMTVIVAYVVFL